MIISGIALPRKAEHGPGRHSLCKDWKAQASHTVALRGGSSGVWTARAGITKHRSSMISSFGVVLGLDGISNTLRFTERSSLACRAKPRIAVVASGVQETAREWNNTRSNARSFLVKQGSGQAGNVWQWTALHKHSAMRRSFKGWSGLHRQGGASTYTRTAGSFRIAMDRKVKQWKCLLSIPVERMGYTQRKTAEAL